MMNNSKLIYDSYRDNENSKKYIKDRAIMLLCFSLALPIIIISYQIPKIDVLVIKLFVLILSLVPLFLIMTAFFLHILGIKIYDDKMLIFPKTILFKDIKEAYIIRYGIELFPKVIERNREILVIEYLKKGYLQKIRISMSDMPTINELKDLFGEKFKSFPRSPPPSTDISDERGP